MWDQTGFGYVGFDRLRQDLVAAQGMACTDPLRIWS